MEVALRGCIQDPGQQGFTFMLDRVAEFMASGPSGYLLLEGEEGAGKSLVAEMLLSARMAGKLDTAVARFPIRRGVHEDDSTLIEVINEHLRLNFRCATAGLKTLDMQVTRDFHVRYPGALRDRRMSAFLQGLALVNGGGILLVLDGVDDGPPDIPGNIRLADFLPAEPPHGVFVVLTYDPASLQPSLAQRVQELKLAGSPHLPISTTDPAYQQLLHQALSMYPAAVAWTSAQREEVLMRANGCLGAVRQLTECVLSGLFPSTSRLPSWGAFYGAFFQALEARVGSEAFQSDYLHFFLLLAANFRPVPLDELSTWGGSANAVTEVLRICPSMFTVVNDWTGPCIGLAHESLRAYLRASHAPAYRDVCRSLAMATVEALLAPEGTPEPESGRYSFPRLYMWAVESRNPSLAEWVARSKGLARTRIHNTNELEARIRFHQKIAVLDTWKDLLKYLVQERGCLDLRDELAWAYSSRGLTYLRMGQFERALIDIGKAIDLFVPMVEQEHQEKLRNGLAAAYNRRSEACRYLGKQEQALADAGEAVRHYKMVVESQGRVELSNLLALAYQNRAVIQRSINLTAARADCDAAIRLYEQQKDTGSRTRQDLASCYHTRGVVCLSQGDLTQALSDSGRAISLFADLVSGGRNELSNDLAAAYNNRGGASHRIGQFEDAVADYGRGIAIRSELVAAGRLDLRNDLALTYTNRAIVVDYLGRREEALADYTAAIDFRFRLVEQEGRVDLAPELAQTHIYRGTTLRTLQRHQEALDDYTRAINIFAVLVDRDERRDLARQLSLAYNSQGLTYLDLGDLQRAAESCSRAISVHAGRSPAELPQELRVDLAVAHNNRGEAYRRMGDFRQAQRDYGYALEVYGQAVAEGNRELRRDLGLTQNNRAQVSLVLEDGSQARDDSTRALEIFIQLIEQEGRGDLVPHLASAYSTRGAALSLLKSFEKGLQDLGRAIDLYKLLIEDSGRIDYYDELALAYRRRAKSLLELGKLQGSGERLAYPRQALEDFTQAVTNYELAVQRDKGGPYQVELVRTQLLRTELHEQVGDHAAALQDATAVVEHFAGQLADGDYSYVRDLLAAFKRRAEVYLASGNQDEALLEYGRLINLCTAATERDPNQDYRGDLAEAYNNRAWTRTSLGQLVEAFQDYARSLDLYRKLVVEEGRLE
ncbi:MAG: tetratricopeptide repeat protein, partial [Candidatus Eremiobacterota bacterium]